MTPDLLPQDGPNDPLSAPTPAPPLQQVDLFALDQEGLAAQLKAWGEPAFRAKQLHKWIHERHAGRFADMTDLPAALRKRLEAEARLGVLEIEAEQRSKDGTRKRLYRLPDGQLIESVLMPYADGRQTACISSQAGCAMACAFCATGQMGFARQLSAAEIAEQAWRFDQELKAEGQRLSNVVLMGMGEPFHNFDAVVSAIGRLNRDIGIGADGSVWVIGLDPAPGGNGVHRWQQGQWLRIDGGGVRVAVGPDGQPWVVQASGTVLRRMGAAWQPLPGRASDIAVGSDGTAWVIGAETGSGNAGILRWAGGRWQRVDGVAQSIAVR